MFNIDKQPIVTENRFEPNLENYQKQAIRMLKQTSRTAAGILDFSASPEKSAQMDKNLTADNASEKAIDNYKKAVTFIFENKNLKMDSPQAVKAFIEKIESIVNSGITEQGLIYRGHGKNNQPELGYTTKKINYTKIEDLMKELDDFCKQVYEKLTKLTPSNIEKYKEQLIELAAFMEYRINMSDHFFTDGCGKISRLAGAWILMKGDLELPDFHKIIPEGEEKNVKSFYKAFYPNNPQLKPRGEDPAHDIEAEKKYTALYKNFFANKYKNYDKT